MKISLLSKINFKYDEFNSKILKLIVKNYYFKVKYSLLSETKINYWFKHLLNCNISAILVAEIMV